MEAAAYRKQYEEELHQAAEKRESFSDIAAGKAARSAVPTMSMAAESDLEAALVALADRDQDPELRGAALRVVGSATGSQPEFIDRLLELLTDTSERLELRMAALTALQESSFHSASFTAKRPQVQDALRSVVDDANAELRRRVLGILARSKDDYAQRRLLAGIKDPAQALVPLAKAIQFLGYDIHAEHYPLLRDIAASTKNRAAKKQAVRILAADPGSRDLLAGILNDSSDAADVRMLSAIGLQALDPERFEAQARQIVLDNDEDEQVRATCINALTHFANPATYAEDSAFTERVEDLRAHSTSPQMKHATATYLSKYRP